MTILEIRNLWLMVKIKYDMYTERNTKKSKNKLVPIFKLHILKFLKILLVHWTLYTITTTTTMSTG